MAVQEAFVLMWSKDPAAIADWAVAVLGFEEVWRAPPGPEPEHVELAWGASKISINVQTDSTLPNGPCGISVRIDDRARVAELYERAQSLGANIAQPLAESRVAYSFTALDADGNQWWVNAETGFLDELRG